MNDAGECKHHLEKWKATMAYSRDIGAIPNTAALVSYPNFKAITPANASCTHHGSLRTQRDLSFRDPRRYPGRMHKRTERGILRVSLAALVRKNN